MFFHVPGVSMGAVLGRLAPPSRHIEGMKVPEPPSFAPDAPPPSPAPLSPPVPLAPAPLAPELVPAAPERPMPFEPKSPAAPPTLVVAVLSPEPLPPTPFELPAISPVGDGTSSDDAQPTIAMRPRIPRQIP